MSEFFGKVISRYTLEQAIDDGFHADFGYIHPKMRVVATTNFMETVNKYQLMHIVVKTLANIKHPEPNWVVFEKDEIKEHLEDEGRTLITHIDGLKEKVYAILENHGTHYVLTFLLASDY